MATFDMDSYLRNRYGSSGTDKIDALARASQEKIAQLRQVSDPARLAAVQARNEKTVVGKLGLEPDSILGYPINAAAGLASAVSTATGMISSGVHDLRGMASSQALDDNVLAARQRELEGTATQADWDLLDRPRAAGITQTAAFKKRMAEAGVTTDPIESLKRTGAATNRDLVRQAEAAQRDASTMRDFFDVTSVVHQGNKDALVDDLKGSTGRNLDQVSAGYDKFQNGDVLSGLADMVSGAAGAIPKIGKAAINNPLGALDYVIESAPQSAAAMAGGPLATLASAAYGLDTYGKGVEAYSKKNDGAVAPSEQRKDALLWGALAAGSEYAGGAAMRAGKLAKAGLVNPVDEAASAAVEAVSKEGLRAQLKGALSGAVDVVKANPVTQWANGTLMGAAGEFPTEAFQTMAENMAKGEGTTLEDAFVSGAIGAITGGTVSSGAAGAALNVAKAAPLVAAGMGTAAYGAVKTGMANRQDKAQAEAAAKTGDVSAFTDPKSSNFDPVKAMGFLYQNNQLDSTDAATKEANHQKAAGIVESLTTKLETLQADLPEGKAKVQEQLTVAEQKLAALDPTKTDEAKDLQFEIDYLKEEAARPALEGDALKAAQKEYAKLQKTHTQATTLLQEQTAEARKQQTAVTPEELTAHVTAATAPVDLNDPVAVEVSTKSANVVLNLSMISPEKVDPTTALAVANNPNNGLNEQQRTYLRTLPAARQAEALLKNSTDVSREIYFGNKAKEMVGIADYRNNLSDALAVGNKKLAERQFSGIVKFLESHQDKAEKAKRALELSNINVPGEGRKAQQVVRTDKGWVVEPLSLSDEDLRKNGGLKVHRNSDKDGFITGIGKEATAIGSAIAEMEAAYELKFGSKPAVTANVKVPAATAAQQPVTNTIQPTTANTQGATNGTQTPQAVQATAQRAQAATASTNPSTVPAEAAVTEGNVDQAIASEGNVEIQPENVQVSDPRLNPEASEYVPPWKDIEGTEPDTDAAMSELQTRYPERSFRRAAESEQVTLTNTLDKLRPLLKDSIGAIKKIVVHEGNAAAGTSYGQTGVIGIRPDVFTTPVEGIDASPEARVLRVVSHELHHVEDRRYSTADGKYWSESQPTYNQGGTMYAAAERLVRENHPAAKWFSYIFDSTNPLPSNKQARELFAQWSTLEVVNPELYRDITAQETFETVRTTETETGVSESGSSETASQASDQGRDVEGSASESEGESRQSSGLKLFGQYKKDLTGNLKDLFTKLNLVAQFFVQKKANDRYTTDRPLVAQKDFLSTWNPAAYLEDGENLTDEQVRALNSLYASMKEWLPTLRQSFVPFSGKESELNYKHLDMSHYFLEDANGNPAEVEENVLTAMGYSGYQYVLGEANSPARKTQKEINALHSKAAEGWIHRDGYKMLQGMSSMESTFVNDLGTVAVQALGLKLRDDAPQNLLPNLQVALGSHILALLEDRGLIRRVELPADQVNDYFMSDEELADEGRSRMSDDAWQQKWAREPKTKTYQYIQFVRNPDMSLTPEAQVIKSANYKSGDVVNKLFGADVAPLMAHTEPQKFTQETAQKTNQEISKLQREVIQKTMEIPHRVIPAMMGMFGALGSQALLEIAGAVDTSKTRVHKVNRDSVQAQNDNVQNQLDLLQEQIAQDPSGEEYAQEYFVSASVWRNFRAGFMNAAMNLQTSKIHRFMFARPDWTTTIKMDDVAMVNEFKIAVAMNLGLVKTDQQTNAESLAMFEAKMAAPGSKAKKAVDAIRENLIEGSGSWTNETIDLVKEVSVKGEGMMTLQALVAYAHYEQALATKSADFTVTLLVGADGKTNGPILTHLALGAAGDVDGLYVLLNRGGMYSTDENQAEHYSAYYQGGKGKDLYQDLSSNTITRIKTKVVSQETKDALAGTEEAKSLVTGAEFAAVQTITKELMVKDEVTSAGRNLVKTPLTSFAFGSSLKKSIQNMENKFIESFYSRIEDIANGDAKGLTLEELLTGTNTLIERSNSSIKSDKRKTPLLPKTASITSMLERELTPQQEQALRKAFREVVGTSVKEEMESYFRVFIDRRSDLNKSIQASYAVYAAAYADARIAEIKRLMAEGKIAYRVGEKGENKGKQVPLHDLTVAQEKKLRVMFMDMAPVMHTAYSQAEDNINAGLYMAKSENGVSDASVYQNKVKLGVPLKNGQKNVNSASTTRREISPGVAGVPYSIHSLDSANMHMALAEVGLEQSMNVHDEIGNGVGKIAKAAEAINRTTAENFLNFSPAREAARRLEEMVISMSQRVYAGTVSQEAVKKMFDDWAEIYNKGIMEPELHITPEMAGQVMMDMTMRNAFSADHLRLGAFAKMGVIDQYTWEGGQFKVTPELRKQAEEAIKKLPTGPSENFQQAIKYLGFIYDKNPDAAAAYPEWANQDQTMDEEFDVAPKAESTSQLGAPGVVASVVVEAIAEQIPEVAQAVSEGVSVVEAINQQPLQERTKAIQAIADAAHSVPSSLYSPWGAIGTPSQDTDWALVSEFEKHGGEMTGEQAHAVLTQLFANSKRTNEVRFQMQILEQTKRMIPADLKVIYVTPNTPMSAALEKQADRSRGWYQTNTAGQKVVYILSHEHAHAMVDKEVLAHELLHAALGQTIQEVLNGGGTSEAKSAVKDLQGLLEKTKEFMATNHALNTKFAPAIVDVHELVTWGMTNRDFQQKVLEQVSYTPAKPQGARESGLKKFIQKLADLIFPSNMSSNERRVTGLYALITNVSDLFHAEAANKTQLDLALNLSQINVDPLATVQDYTTEDIYDALPGSVSPTFDGQLRELLSGLVAKLHGPAGSLKAELMANQTITATDVWSKALVTGQAPFASKLSTSGFITNGRESFVADQVEAVMRGALSDDSSSTFVARDTLAKLFKEARSRIKPQDFYRGSDWTTATPEEQQKATDEWKFIFSPEAGVDNRSDFLSRFAALGLASERFNVMLQFNTAMNDAKFGDQKTLADKLKWVLDKAMDFFNGKLTQTFSGQRADVKLSSLVDQLVTIEAKRRGTVAKSMVGGVLGMFETGATKVAGAVRDKVVAVAKTDFVRNNTFTVVKLAGTAARIALPEKRLELAMDLAQDMRDKYMGGRRGLVASLLDEVRGPKAVVQALLRATKHLEGLRKSMITNTAKLALGSFANGGSKLTKESKAAITSVLLRTDVQSLLGKYDLEQIQKLLESKKELDQAIKDHIGELTAYPDYIHYFKTQADVLGYKLATGRAKSPGVMLNAGNIARMYETPNANKLTEIQAAKAEQIIDRLATLYALSYVPTAAKEAAIEVVRTEAQRTDGGNGIEMVLKLHKKQVLDSAELLFLGNEVLITKGYTPEIYNPYIDVRVAHTDAEAQELLDKGYKPGPLVGLDPNDPNREQGRLYKLQDGGLPPRQTGIISYKGDGTKGSTLHDGNLNLSTPEGAANQARLQAMNTARRTVLAQMFQPNPGFRPQASTVNFMVPVMNGKGEFSNWRYVMQEDTKDNLLERTNDFDQILGVLAGNILDKQSTQEQNHAAIQAMRDQYVAGFASKPSGFIKVSHNSPDPEMQEIYRLLPEVTRQSIRQIWGRDGMMVPIEMVNIMFGYQKYSMSSMWDKKKEDRTRTEQAITMAAEIVIGQYAKLMPAALGGGDAEEKIKRIAVIVRKGGRIWQEIVREVKDIVVVRSIKVMADNIKSNMSLLFMYGVPPSKWVKLHREAIKGLTAYQRDSAELFRLKTKLEAGYTRNDEQELADQIAMLEDSLARNPVKDLIDAGMMPTIVEDVGADDDQYSYRSQLTKWVDNKTSKLHPLVREAGKQIYMGKGTQIYQGLSKITQASDFVARYTLYQHLTTRESNPMTKDQAIQEASDAFINYDIPMHRGMQWLDDHGFVMFTKYFLRIQRVLMKLTREKPGNVLMTLAVGNYLDMASSMATSASALGRIGNNPFSTGALMYPTVLDELPAVGALMGLVK